MKQIILPIWMFTATVMIGVSGCGSGDLSSADSRDGTIVGSTTDDNISTLKKTGQIYSFDARSNKVSNCAIRDDGCYQKGVTPDYSRDNNTQVVTDNITHLMWQDDTEAKTLTKKRLTDAQQSKCHTALLYDDNASECYQTDGDTATTYCQNLILGGYDDWRLPSVRELRSIVVYGKRNPSMNQKVFKNISGNPYWSSDVFIHNVYYAHRVNSHRGNISINFQNIEAYVRCVRGAHLPAVNLARDSGNEIVVDKGTHLAWQDNDEVKTDNKTWIQAIDYCENLTLGGFDNWRLPNIRELKSIIDLKRKEATTYKAFENYTENQYWSSTSYAKYEYHAWTADFSNASDYTQNKRKKYLVRCVRDNKNR